MRKFNSVKDDFQVAGKGKVATLLVQRGILSVGQYLVAGTAWARVRTMTDEGGKTLKGAGPSVPVEVSLYHSIHSDLMKK